MGRKSARKRTKQKRPSAKSLNESDLEIGITTTTSTIATTSSAIESPVSDVSKNKITSENPKKKFGPMRIDSRLSLPVFFVDEEDEDEDWDEEDGLEFVLNFRPRRYFSRSLCQICPENSRDLEFSCQGCGMVSYCSEKHRRDDLKSHRELCAVLKEICLENDGLSLALNLSPDEYRGFRLGLVEIAQSALGRCLELWEREILLFPRLCRSCHRFGPEVQTCPDCAQEYFCPEHRSSHLPEHCRGYQIFRRILGAQRSQPPGTRSCPRLPNRRLEVYRQLPPSLDHLVLELFGGVDHGNYGRLDCTSYSALSQMATPALTALHALESIGWTTPNASKDSMVVHVIGAELQFECVDLLAWEKLMLHRLPQLRILRLEFCGPELVAPPELLDALSRPRLCARCRAEGRRLEIKLHCNKLYHQVALEAGSEPDLVCLFNPGLYRMTGFAGMDTWPRTIEKFCRWAVPVLVTSYTELELPLDFRRIREVAPGARVELEPTRNPFASLRPERNFVSDELVPLIYKNFYLGVVRGSGTAENIGN